MAVGGVGGPPLGPKAVPAWSFVVREQQSQVEAHGTRVAPGRHTQPQLLAVHAPDSGHRFSGAKTPGSRPQNIGSGLTTASRARQDHGLLRSTAFSLLS